MQQTVNLNRGGTVLFWTCTSASGFILAVFEDATFIFCINSLRIWMRI